MKKSLLFWQFVGFVFTGVVGTLLHFLYGWTDNTFFALFSAVNESIWEHMKILFFPMFIFAFLEKRCFAEDYKNFWCAKLIGVLTGLAVIPTMYYTYTGALGVSVDWFNIITFFIAAAISYLLETLLLKNKKKCCLSSTAAIVILYLIATLFVIFTFMPPEIPVFQDPATKPYVF